jgi:hypothetical protein
MSERTPLVESARDLLAEEPAPVAPPSDAESARIVAMMAAEIVRARRRKLVARSAIGLSLAAGALFGVFALHARHPSLAVHPAAAKSETAAIAAGHHVVVPVGERRELVLPSGSRIEAFEKADLIVTSVGASQTFSLDAGEARFHVKKLGPGERFVVHTSDSEVEVHGTVFTVKILAGEPVCGSHTRVDVLEGVVTVSQGGRVASIAPGAHFPVCAPIAPPQPSVTASVEKAPLSTIAAQNQLFAAGIDAKKRGDRAAAIAAFDGYLAKYPNGFLAESAEVERMRLSVGTQQTAAAKAYLARHPRGFARAEAKAILDAP